MSFRGGGGAMFAGWSGQPKVCGIVMHDCWFECEHVNSVGNMAADLNMSTWTRLETWQLIRIWALELGWKHGRWFECEHLSLAGNQHQSKIHAPRSLTLFPSASTLRPHMASAELWSDAGVITLLVSRSACCICATSSSGPGVDELPGHTEFVEHNIGMSGWSDADIMCAIHNKDWRWRAEQHWAKTKMLFGF